MTTNVPVTPQTFQEKIAFLATQPRSITVELFFLVFAEEEDMLSVQSVPLARNLYDPIIDRIVYPFLAREFRLAEDILEYDPTISPDRRTLFQIAESEVEQFTLNQEGDIQDFDHSGGYSKVNGYFFKISSGDSEIVCVRKKFGSHTLKKGGLSIFFDQQQFSVFDQEIFTLDENIDAVLIDGKFIVFQRTNFERCFLFDQKIKTQATRNLRELIDTYKLIEIDETRVEEFLDTHSIARLRRIDLSLIDDGTMGFDNLVTFCAEYPSIILERDDVTKKFKPCDKKQFKTFIKLLSDDFLESRLTQRKYDAHSKEILI